MQTQAVYSKLVEHLPVFTFLDWGATLLALAQSTPMQIVQIGAMDGKSFDPIYPYQAKYRWPALMVEPLPDHFEALRDNYKDIPAMRFEQAAVADHDGSLTMQRIAPDAVVRGLVPEWMNGVSTATNDRGILNSINVQGEVYALAVQPHIQKVEVPCLTWKALLAKHGITHISVLIVDVEGAEWSILRQIDFAVVKPRLVYIEYSHMSDEEIEACLNKFVTAGYQALRESHSEQNLLFIAG